MPGIAAANARKLYSCFHGVKWPSPFPNTLAKKAVSGSATKKKSMKAGFSDIT